MEKVYKFIIQKTVTDKIAKKDAVQLLELLKLEKDKKRQMDIAVIGMAAKTSRAENVDEFWNNLKDGLDCIREIPMGRQDDLDKYLQFKGLGDDKLKYRSLAYLDEIDKFDYEYFNLTPREAELMDPNQRLFLETACAAIEDGGYSRKKIKGTKTGLYLGYITSNYSYQNLLYEADAAVGATTILANLAALIPSRVSYTLDLRGPSILVDTTCSSSLVAVHLACQALRTHECDQAIVGGVKINLLPLENGPKIGIESSTARTHAFDEMSDGTGQGEGVGAIFLKPLSAALRDGDNIRAVIKGSAINQDGASMGITAPNALAQAEVIGAAWEAAQIDPTTISYIEAHGTGTKLGDPIEIEGISRAFREYTNQKQFCALGSVKSNIGHLDEAAGIFGLIKTILSIENKQIPASINFHEPNHKIDWEEAAVFVNNKLIAWENKGGPLRAGISSFGLSGTNCHVVLEEAPILKINKPLVQTDRVLTLSAKNKKALADLVIRYRDFLNKNEDINLDDFCFTANTGRNHDDLRLALIFDNQANLLLQLEKILNSDELKIKSEKVFLSPNFLNKNTKANEVAVSFDLEEKKYLLEKLYKALKRHPEAREDFLEELCRLYVEGAEVDWEELYKEINCRRLSLPTYPFLRKRSWFKLPNSEKQDIYFELKWQEEELVVDPIETESILVFRGKSKQSSAILKGLAEEVGENNVVNVDHGKKFHRFSARHYSVGNSLEDYEKLVADLGEARPSKIVHLFSLSDRLSDIKNTTELEEAEKSGVYSFFYLTKALFKYFPSDVFNLVVVSDFANQVTGREKIIKPENASLLGFGKGVWVEFMNWRCRVIDIDNKTLSEKIVNEIRNEYHDHKVAYREDSRYVEVFHRLNPIASKPIKIRPQGVYLFSGGTGGIVPELARFLSEQEKVKIVLLSRSGLKSRDKWEKIISNPEEELDLRHRYELLLAIEKNGSKIYSYAVDVADEKQLSLSIERIRKEVGEINGVIHAAGVAREKFFDKKTEADLLEVLNPKVKGLWLLNHFVPKKELDFFSLFSSAITVFGGAQNSDYIAANSYLDAFALWGRKKGINFTAVDWPFWEKTGMHVRQVISQVKVPIYNISPRRGAQEWFKSLTNNSPAWTIVGELNHSGQTAHLIKYSPFIFSPELISQISDNINATLNSGIIDRVEMRGADDYSQIERDIAQILYDVLGYKEIDVKDNFFDLGGDSLFLVEIFSRLEKKYPNRLNITQLFTYPTVGKLAEFIGQTEIPQHENSVKVERSKSNDIAVIGLAAKTSLADDYEIMWQNLMAGRESIREIPKERKKDIDNYLRMAGADEKYLAYSPLAYLNHIDQFDYEYFKFSPREAKLMDPNQRLFLETVITAFEMAGLGGEKLKGSNTGLYLGYGQSDFEYKSFVSNAKMANSTALFTGNLNALIPSRISYLLDLRGPSMVIDTACSSSLVAIHLACQSLISGDCEIAVAGGVHLNLVPLLNGFKVGIESSDWHTRSFDNESDGTGMGEGVAAVILKPLEKSLDDGDQVFAIIKGSAINQDGQTVGITAPNTRAQTDVIKAAWANAQIDPSDISYIEAHGTGTSLGDPIEIEGITNAFRGVTNKKQFCALSTIKPNLGHTLEAAGIFSFIKAVLSLRKQLILPSINFHEPNHQVNWEESAVFVNDKIRQWKSAEDKVRLCGVSSFGLSGTNCHIVLAEAKETEKKNEGGINIFTLSAKNKISFKNLIQSYLNYFQSNKKVDLEALCYTANTGRGHYEERLVIVAETVEELSSKLLSFKKTDFKTNEKLGVFYHTHRVVSSRKKDISSEEITENQIGVLSREAQPYVKKLSQSKKFAKNFLIKISRFYVAGAKIDWEKIYFHKTKIKIALPTYPFLPNRCWPDEDEQIQAESRAGSLQFLHPLLERCVVKSTDQDIYSTIFSSKKHFVLGDHIINGSHVLPGTVYLEIAKQLGRLYYGELPLEIKNLNFITPVITEKDEQKEVQIIVKEQGGYKKFFAASQIFSSDGTSQWLRHVEGEIYPRTDLSVKNISLANLKKKCSEKKVDVDINKNAAGFIEFGLRWQNFHAISFGNKEALAELELPRECIHDLETYFLHPPMVDMAAAAVSMVTGFKALPFSYGSFRVMAPLPRKFYSHFKRIGEYDEVEETVAFDFDLVDQHGRVLVEVENFRLKRTRDFERIIKRNKGNQSRKFYKTYWEASEIIEKNNEKFQGPVLVFAENNERAENLISALKKTGQEIVRVSFGNQFIKKSENNYLIENKLDDYTALIKDLKSHLPKRIIHLSSFSETSALNNLEALEQSQKLGVFSLFYLIKALTLNVVKERLDIVLVSQYVHQISGTEKELRPENASLIGFGKTPALEDSNWQCRAIDIDQTTDEKKIIAEINSGYSTYNIAFRDNIRYNEILKHFNPEIAPDRDLKIRKNGNYLITGGAGGVGLELSARLAKLEKVNLILLNRSKVPPRSAWSEIKISNNPLDERAKKIIASVEEIEKSGSRVIIIQADISKPLEAEATLKMIRQKYGALSGVVHAAGVPGDGFIAYKDEETIRKVLAPKVQGAWLLEKLTRKEKLDFFVLFSSSTSFHSAFGQSDYTAANCFLDTFGEYLNKQGRRTLIINWSGWKEVGMLSANKRLVSYGTLTNEEAISSFLAILKKDITSIAIGQLTYVEGILFSQERFPLELSNEVKAEIFQNSLSREALKERKTEQEIKIKGSTDSKNKELELTIAHIWSEVLGITEIDVNDHFFDLGGDSLRIAEVHSLLEKKYPGKFSVAELFAYPTISKLVQHAGVLSASDQTSSGDNSYIDKNQDMAIIGMAVRTSLAEDSNEFWQNLVKGVDCIREVPVGRQSDMDAYLLFRGLDKKHLRYQVAAYLEDIDKFDNEYFRISPREASLMDPNQRVLLQTIYHTIENAGYNSRRLNNSKTGLYVGLFPLGARYYDMIAELEPSALSEAMVNNMEPTIASRVSYYLNLIGPSMLVNTACSSSLVAVHLACQAIRNGDCEQAIVGSVKINLLNLAGNPKVGIESQDGHTRTFDNDSDGTGLGEGSAAIMIKPLAQAINDGDNVLAVIKGSAINQDGQSVGMTAPNALSQTEVVLSAWRSAGIEAETISYIEAHGTGTNLGDPIEIEALASAFRKSTNKKQFCAIASVKSNLGHLLEAAGIFGLLKTVLALNNELLPPTINFHEPNQKVNWEDSPVFINNKVSAWPRSDGPRRAGISSFGLSGTNCHVVIEEAPFEKKKIAEKINDSNYIFTLSARNRQALKSLVEKYSQYLENNQDVNLDDMCYTLSTGRDHHNYRLAISTGDLLDLQKKLKIFLSSDFKSGEDIEYNEFKIVPYGQKNKINGELTDKEARALGGELEIIVREFIFHPEKRTEFLKRICQLYVQGADFDWLKLYKEKKCHKLALPLYPFANERAWLNLPHKENYAGYFHQIKWLPQALTQNLQVETTEPYLLFGSDQPWAQEISRVLKTHGRKVIKVKIGSEYRKINNNNFVIRNDKTDYKELFSELREQKFSQIIHLLSLDNNQECLDLNTLVATQKNGIFSLMFLVQALQANSITRDLDLYLLTENADRVDGSEEAIKPENATMIGFAKGLAMENPNIRCRSIDIDSKTPASIFCREISSRTKEYKVAYRQSLRYIEQLTQLDFNELSENNLLTSAEGKLFIRKNGVYVISGGTGGIGLQIAKNLAQREQVKIVLLNRSHLPERKTWDSLINADGPKDRRLIERLENLKEIEALDSEVFFISVDVSKQEALSTALDQVRSKHGAINGIIHAAGIAGGGFIAQKGEAELRNALAPKVQGTWLMDHLTRGDKLDFFVLFSSAISLVSGIGVSEYTAANSYLDSYAWYAEKQGRKITTINWATWENIGLSAGEEVNEKKQLLRILPVETGLTILSEILKKDVTRIVAGKINYESDILLLGDYLPLNFSDEINHQAGQRIELVQKQIRSVKLKGGKDDIYTDMEKELASIWSEVLGYREIDIRDNFFELGGDSLSGIRLIARINKQLNRNLSFREILQHSTLNSLATFVAQVEQEEYKPVIKKVKPKQYKLK